MCCAGCVLYTVPYNTTVDPLPLNNKQPPAALCGYSPALLAIASASADTDASPTDSLQRCTAADADSAAALARSACPAASVAAVRHTCTGHPYQCHRMAPCGTPILLLGSMIRAKLMRSTQNCKLLHSTLHLVLMLLQPANSKHRQLPASPSAALHTWLPPAP